MSDVQAFSRVLQLAGLIARRQRIEHACGRHDAQVQHAVAEGEHDVRGHAFALGARQGRRRRTPGVALLVMQVEVGLVEEEQAVSGEERVAALGLTEQAPLKGDQRVRACLGVEEGGTTEPQPRFLQRPPDGGGAGQGFLQHTFPARQAAQFFEGGLGVLLEEAGQAHDGAAVEFAPAVAPLRFGQRGVSLLLLCCSTVAVDGLPAHAQRSAHVADVVALFKHVHHAHPEGVRQRCASFTSFVTVTSFTSFTSSVWSAVGVCLCVGVRRVGVRCVRV